MSASGRVPAVGFRMDNHGRDIAAGGGNLGYRPNRDMEASSLDCHNQTLNGPTDHRTFSCTPMAKRHALVSVIWLNWTIGFGKSAIGEAPARLIPYAR